MTGSSADRELNLRTALVYLGLSVAVLITFFQGRAPQRTAPYLVAAALTLLMVAEMIVLAVRVHWITATGLVVTSLALTVLSPQTLSVVGVFLAVAMLGARVPTRPGAGGAAALALMAFAALRLGGARPAPLALLLGGMFFVLAFAGPLATRRMREDGERTRRLLTELEQSRAGQLEAAAMAERTRIAREVHDVLAHSLSALAIQLQSATLLLDERPQDPAGPAAVRRAYSLARQGLDDARQAVLTLRGDAVPDVDGVVELVRRFEEDTGTPSLVGVDASFDRLGPEARLAVYRTAQEALTNIRKHSRPSRVELRLDDDSAGVVLVIEDSDDRGVPESGRQAGGGYGLAGMRERAELLGGRLAAGPTATGFRVELWLPA